MKKRKIITIIVIIIIGLGIAFTSYYFLKSKEGTDKSIDTNVTIDNSDEDIDWDSYTSSNIELEKSIVIDKEGVYHLTGSISDGMITVNTKGNIKLILDNVNISNSNGPAIYVISAKKIVISTSDGSINTLSDGSNYSNLDDDVEGVIYSKDDLILEGDGTLVINSNKGDGIVGKDNIKIKNGTYNIKATDDGIRGKDSVYIVDGIFNITAAGDGIKSTNEKDSSLGFVKIMKGTFKIEAGMDGIQAESKLLIEDGEFEIMTGNGASNSSQKTGWGKWNNTVTSSDSAKGLKAGSVISINGGIFTLNTSDDAVHSNGSILISNGEFVISSGDDGVHADEELTIDNGKITIDKSYEGLEANDITINDGDISIVASDDGINAAGGNDSSAVDRPGASPDMNYSSNSKITINGGNILVNASGDGIDANGSIYVNGGTIYVNGPTDNGNGALDYDGEFVITKGTILAIGSSGMAQSIGNSSSQYGVLIYLTNTYNKDTKITIKDADGKEIISYTAIKSFSSIVFSSSELSKNSTYSLYLDDTLYSDFTISDINTVVGSTNNSMNGNGGGPGGRR